MISEETAATLAALEAVQDSQQPDKAVRASIANKTLLCVVGATCMGKSSIMEAVATLDTKIKRASTVTSRPAQERDKPGDYRRYYEHTDVGLAPLLNDIHDGRVVQYALNPATKHLMATYPEDYPGDVNIRDVYATSVDAFEKLGFGKLAVFSAITPYQTWKQRLDARFDPIEAAAVRAKRLEEAVISLEWSLAHGTQPNHHWLINDGTPADAARDLLSILGGEQSDEAAAAAAVRIAEDCLNHVRGLLP